MFSCFGLPCNHIAVATTGAVGFLYEALKPRNMERALGSTELCNPRPQDGKHLLQKLGLAAP